MPAPQQPVDDCVVEEALTPKAIEVFTDSPNIERFETVAEPILVYGGCKKAITPRDIILKVNKLVADSIANCAISDTLYLALFQEALAELLMLSGDKKYNNFIARVPIQLEPGVSNYDLPSNIDKIIALWSEKDTKWYTIKKKIDFVPRQAWSQNNREYTFTIEKKKLLLLLPYERERDACGCCTNCDHCQLIFGTLNLEYYFLPDLPETLDEPMWWFWDHLSAEKYLQEILLEMVYERNKQSYVSPTKESYRMKLLEFDNNLNPIDATPKINKKSFKFSRF